MDLLSAIVLGLIQGFTEWLPISSSGHLVIAQALLGIDAPAEFNIVIMIGTTAALLLYFKDKVLSLFFGLLKGDKISIQYLIFMIIAGIPTAIIGFAGKAFFKGLFGQPIIVSCLIIVTGIFLLIASRKKGDGEKMGELNPKNAAIIGFAQGIAVAPGISRSGSTIGTALLLGIRARDAAEFSFLIGVPAMALASLLEFASAQSIGLDISIMAVGVLAAFVAGYASIGVFMKLLEKERMNLFGYYCIIAGAIFTILLFLRS